MYYYWLAVFDYLTKCCFRSMWDIVATLQTHYGKISGQRFPGTIEILRFPPWTPTWKNLWHSSLILAWPNERGLGRWFNEAALMSCPDAGVKEWMIIDTSRQGEIDLARPWLPKQTDAKSWSGRKHPTRLSGKASTCLPACAIGEDCIICHQIATFG